MLQAWHDVIAQSRSSGFVHGSCPAPTLPGSETPKTAADAWLCISACGSPALDVRCCEAPHDSSFGDTQPSPQQRLKVWTAMGAVHRARPAPTAQATEFIPPLGPTGSCPALPLPAELLRLASPLCPASGRDSTRRRFGPAARSRTEGQKGLPPLRADMHNIGRRHVRLHYLSSDWRLRQCCSEYGMSVLGHSGTALMVKMACALPCQMLNDGRQ